jgi:hypothetical protein
MDLSAREHYFRRKGRRPEAWQREFSALALPPNEDIGEKYVAYVAIARLAATFR